MAKMVTGRVSPANKLGDDDSDQDDKDGDQVEADVLSPTLRCVIVVLAVRERRIGHRGVLDVARDRSTSMYYVS